MMKILCFLGFLVIANICDALSPRDLYETIVRGSVTLPPANDEAAKIQLHLPIHFCTESYDEIYVSYNFYLLFDRQKFFTKKKDTKLNERVQKN